MLENLPNEILVIHYYKSIVDGVMTSLIDAFFNLRRGVRTWPVYMKIICPELYMLERNDYYNFDLDKTQWYEYKNNTGLDVEKYEKNEDAVEYNLRLYRNELTTAIPFLRFNRNFGDFNLFSSITQNQKKFKAKIIVCSARLIYEIMMGADIEIECNRLFVLDSLDTYKSKIGIFPNFDDYFEILNADVTQLSNPATMRETKYRQVLYHHKFSQRRLNALKQSDILKDEYNFKRSSKEKTKIEDGHFENLGKGLFENLYWNKTVNYYTDGMYMMDGMAHYLELFGIDPNVDHLNLKLAKHKIKDKLFMKNKDYLFREVNRG